MAETGEGGGVARGVKKRKEPKVEKAGRRSQGKKRVFKKRDVEFSDDPWNTRWSLGC